MIENQVYLFGITDFIYLPQDPESNPILKSQIEFGSGFETASLYLFILWRAGEQHGEQRDLQQRVGGPEQAGAPLLHCVSIYLYIRRAAP